MRVLFVSQYFFTRDLSGGSRLVELIEHLTARGHRVSLVTTFIDNFRKQVIPQYRGRWFLREELPGAEVLRVWAYSGYRGSMRRRYLNFFSFLAGAVMGGLRARRPDVVMATSPPLTVALAGWAISRLRRVPFVFEVRDLWPDAAVALGVIRSPRVIRLATAGERFLYQRAARIITISPGLKRHLVEKKGVPAEKISVVTQGARAELFRGEGSEVRSRLGLDGKFITLYAGALGINNALDVFFHAARELADDPRFAFLVVGDGDRLEELKEFGRRHELGNLLFVPPVPKTEVGGFMAAADCCFLGVPDHYSDCALPNKLFEYLAAGRPVVVSGGGRDIVELLEDARTGTVTPGDDTGRLVGALREYERDDARRLREGESARRFAEASLGWHTVLGRLEGALQGVASGGKVPGGP